MPGNWPRAWAKLLPSTIKSLIRARVRFKPWDLVWGSRASRAPTRGKPAPIKVASWRVISATSEGLTRASLAPKPKVFRLCLGRASCASRMETVYLSALRSFCRAAWTPSASMMPDVVRPLASSAVYS